LGHLDSSGRRLQTSGSIQNQFTDLGLLFVKVSSGACILIWLDRLLRRFCCRWSTLLYSLMEVTFDSMFEIEDYEFKACLTLFPYSRTS
jgi:hypothetical protein